MSNATFLEACIVGCLFICLGAWMHFLRTPPADREARVIMHRLAVVFLVCTFGLSVVLAVMWQRLHSLHTLPIGNDPTALVVVDAGLAALAAAEAAWTVLLVRRRRA